MIASKEELKTLKGIIYIIKNKINWKRYIGQTTNHFYRRYSAKNGKWWKSRDINKYLKKSIKKYGHKNFEVEIILYNQNLESLNYWETFYIDYFKSNNSKYGYNLTTGGENYKLNDEERLKISKRSMTSLDEFINKAKIIHGNKFDYSKVRFKAFETHIVITCNKCKTKFKQSKAGHLNGYGCKVCFFKNHNKSVKIISFEEFVKLAHKKHGNKFIYFLNNYKGITSKIKIVHKECQKEFIQAGNAHLTNKYCCHHCCWKKSQNAKLKSKDINKIKLMLKNEKVSNSEILRIFNISQTTLYRIKNNEGRYK